MCNEGYKALIIFYMCFYINLHINDQLKEDMLRILALI